ncbi:hypothetical protein FQZ97_773560 [compost metagenome]
MLVLIVQEKVADELVDVFEPYVGKFRSFEVDQGAIKDEIAISSSDVLGTCERCADMNVLGVAEPGRVRVEEARKDRRDVVNHRRVQLRQHCLNILVPYAADIVQGFE